MAYVASVIRAVRDDVSEHFFSCHAASVAVSEAECDAHLQLGACDLGGVLLIPSIRFCCGEMQVAEERGVICVGGGVAVRLAQEMGAEDAVNHIDVVEHADGAVQCAGMHGCGDGDGGELVEELVVGPGFFGRRGWRGGSWRG